MIKLSTKKIIEVQDWDDLVQKTYNKSYSFQQQYGCQHRGLFNLTIPEETNDEEMHDSIQEEVNGPEEGVKFAVWLAAEANYPTKMNNWERSLFWSRNFYPDIQTVANDLHSKGLIEAGPYAINIDW